MSSELVNSEGEFIPIQLTAEDRVYVALLEQGFSKPEAYVEAYRDNDTVKKHLRIIEDAAEYDDTMSESYHTDLGRMARRKAYMSKQRLGQLAREKARTRKIRMAFSTLTRRMEDIAVDGLDVVEEIMHNGKSEKVRADLAIRMIEHQVGQPTQKVLSQSNNEITITIGEAPADTRDAQRVAADKARMEAGIDKQGHNAAIKRRQEQAQEAMVIDMEVDPFVEADEKKQAAYDHEHGLDQEEMYPGQKKQVKTQPRFN